MSVITNIKAREILDSRGLPALEVELTLNNQWIAVASIPSGASTGKYEALELRDEQSQRYHGKGLLKPISHLKLLSEKLKTTIFHSQEELDSFLINEDGTSNKSHLGANTILALSLAYAKAKALSQKQDLFESIREEIKSNSNNFLLPVPLINIINGGAHANNQLDVQEFMIVPYGFDSFQRALRAASEIFISLKKILKDQNFNTAVGDEGGFAPDLPHNELALKLLMQAIEKTGYCPEKEVAVAVDTAASELYQEGGGYLWENKKQPAEYLIDTYQNWLNNYPLVSIEDGLGEEDLKGWVALTKKLGHQTQLIGDDLFATQKNRLKQGINHQIANSLLTKINQVGTLTESYSAVLLAQQNQYTCCVSHRSGETEDTSIADLAVGWGAEQIKTGSVCRGERTAKYNRLLRIEEKLQGQASYYGQKAFSRLKATL